MATTCQITTIEEGRDVPFSKLELLAYRQLLPRRSGSKVGGISGLAGDPDDGYVDMGDEAPSPTRSAPPPKPDAAMLRLLVARALGSRPTLVEAVRAGGDPVFLIEVPDEQLVAAVAVSVQSIVFGKSDVARSGWALDHLATKSKPKLVLFAKDPARRQRPEEGSAGVGYAVQLGTPILGVAVSSIRDLPPELTRIADERIALPPVTPDLVEAVIRLVTRERPSRLLDGTAARALSARDMSLAIRSDRTPDECISRLERIAAANGAVSDSGPRLEDLSGYGEAGEWGLALARDVRAFVEGRNSWVADPGILLFGPPGTGKSTYAKALARSCGMPIVLTSVTEWLGAGKGFLNDVLRRMREDFSRASAMSPAILFIDEINGLLSRSKVRGENQDWWINLNNALLEAFDNLRSNIVVVAACNDPTLLDPALVRSGRLDRMIFVGPPDASARRDILRFHLGKDSLDADLDLLAGLLAGRTGADIEKVVREARKLARQAGRPLADADLLRAITGDPTGNEDVRWRTARHEAAHAVASLVLSIGTVESVSIRQVGNALGHVLASFNPNEASTRERMLDKAVMLLCGRAADQVLSGAAESGAGGGEHSDLARATKLLTRLYSELGLGRSGDLLWRGRVDIERDGIPRDLLTDIRDDLSEVWERAVTLVEEQATAIETLAEALVAKGWLSGTEVAALAGPHLTRQQDTGDDLVTADRSRPEHHPRR